MTNRIRVVKSTDDWNKGAALYIMDDIPYFHRLDEAEVFYQGQAKEIMRAIQHLPGGVFDALLVEMMKCKVSLFSVSHFEEGKDEIFGS